jgi:hypothetical protein
VGAPPVQFRHPADISGRQAVSERRRPLARTPDQGDSAVGPFLAVTSCVTLFWALLLKTLLSGGEATAPVEDPIVTVLVRWEDLSPQKLDQLLRPTSGETCDCVLFRPRSFVFTDRRSAIERLLGHPIPLGQ